MQVQLTTDQFKQLAYRHTQLSDFNAARHPNWFDYWVVTNLLDGNWPMPGEPIELSIVDLIKGDNLRMAHQVRSRPDVGRDTSTL